MIWKTRETENTEEDHLQMFFNEINTREENIKFTVEREKERKIAYLDMEIRREEDHLTTKVYRKTTHTQRYIN